MVKRGEHEVVGKKLLIARNADLITLNGSRQGTGTAPQNRLRRDHVAWDEALAGWVSWMPLECCVHGADHFPRRVDGQTNRRT